MPAGERGRHQTGPRSFNEQPQVGVHVAFLRSMLADGRLALGGPFLDDSGGMAIVRAASLDEARAWAESDESVRGGLLCVEVKPWMAAMDSVSVEA
jgi:uncharacterized protein YciI